MHEGVVGHDGESGGNAYAVVGAECGAVGAHPFTVDDGLDGVVLEVEVLVVALADHIHVALQNHCGGVFVAGGGAFAHYHVADFVGVGVNAVLFGKVKDIFADFLLFFRGTGDFRNLVKNLEDSFRL